eukprot:scaffold119289_cov65-Phaeocystis_antarctica.AAC.3
MEHVHTIHGQAVHTTGLTSAQRRAPRGPPRRDHIYPGWHAGVCRPSWPPGLLRAASLRPPWQPPPPSQMHSRCTCP